MIEQFDLDRPETLPPSMRNMDRGIAAVRIQMYGVTGEIPDSDIHWDRQRRERSRPTLQAVAERGTDIDLDEDYVGDGWSSEEDREGK